MSRPSKTKAIKRLKRARTEISKLKELPRSSPEFTKWRRNTEIVIEYTFGKEGRHIDDFTRVRYSPPVYTTGTPDYVFQQSYEEGLESVATVLESMIEEIEEYWEDEEQAERPNGPQRDEQTDTKRVFVVHGRDDGTRQTVARVIEQLVLQPHIDRRVFLRR